MKVCILTPYCRSEVTAAALRVADLATGFGMDVRVAAWNHREQKVHPYWDSLASGRDDACVYRAMSKSDMVIHFVCSTVALAMADLAAPKAQHILVPPWHQVQTSDLAVMGQFSTLVAPSRVAYQLLVDGLYGGNAPESDRITWTNWDAGVYCVQRPSMASPRTLRVCFYCDQQTIDYCGPMVLNCIHELLGAYPRLNVTMVSTKTWCRRDRRDIAAMISSWDGRFSAEPCNTLLHQARTFQDSDWVVFPGVWSDYGISVARALGAGTPVIAYDVAPFSEIITDTHNGSLVNCEIRANWLKSPYAVPDLTALYNTCADAFKDDMLLCKILMRDWRCNAIGAAFKAAWAELLGVR